MYTDIMHIDITYTDIMHIDITCTDIMHIDITYTDIMHIDITYTDSVQKKNTNQGSSTCPLYTSSLPKHRACPLYTSSLPKHALYTPVAYQNSAPFLALQSRCKSPIEPIHYVKENTILGYFIKPRNPDTLTLPPNTFSNIFFFFLR
ncbi:hypothetical protein BgiMline_007805 [Biomphalaria glabrata]|nr:hypothetical protein BgiMline_018499 [Biomphalaria glabrata]